MTTMSATIARMVVMANGDDEDEKEEDEEEGGDGEEWWGRRLAAPIRILRWKRPDLARWWRVTEIARVR